MLGKFRFNSFELNDLQARQVVYSLHTLWRGKGCVAWIYNPGFVWSGVACVCVCGVVVFETACYKGSAIEPVAVNCDVGCCSCGLARTVH